MFGLILCRLENGAVALRPEPALTVGARRRILSTTLGQSGGAAGLLRKSSQRRKGERWGWGGRREGGRRMDAGKTGTGKTGTGKTGTGKTDAGKTGTGKTGTGKTGTGKTGTGKTGTGKTGAERQGRG